jgi:hypothetical protein
MGPTSKERSRSGFAWTNQKFSAAQFCLRPVYSPGVRKEEEGAKG